MCILQFDDRFEIDSMRKMVHGENAFMKRNGWLWITEMLRDGCEKRCFSYWLWDNTLVPVSRRKQEWTNLDGIAMPRWSVAQVRVYSDDPDRYPKIRSKEPWSLWDQRRLSNRREQILHFDLSFLGREAIIKDQNTGFLYSVCLYSFHSHLTLNMTHFPALHNYFATFFLTYTLPNMSWHYTWLILMKCTL